MARAKDEVERRARAISLVFRQETGRFVPPKFCRPLAEMAFPCGDDKSAPPERDFLSRMRAKIRELRGLGYTVDKMGVDSPALWRMAQDMHHEEVTRQASRSRSDAVSAGLARLSESKEERF